MLETVDVHDVVSGEMDPAGAEGALTPGPESLPGALIHAPHEAESETFKRCQDFELTHLLVLATKKHTIGKEKLFVLFVLFRGFIL